jgi:carotenoid cleavage dioxygenase
MPVNGGYETWGDKLVGPFTAHPKLDPVTGEMVFFGYSAKGRFSKEISLQTVTADGRITRAEILEGPYPSMIHDFAVTRNWIVLPIFPLTSSMERAMSGKPPFAWEPDKGTHIAFIPRNGTVADVKWVSAPASYVFHPMNHYETADGKVVVDVMKYDVAPLFPSRTARPRRPALPLASCSAGPSTSTARQHLQGGAARRPLGRVPALRRALLHERLPPRLDRRRRHHRPEAGEPRQDGLTHYDLKTGKSTAGRPAGRPLRRADLRAARERRGRGRRLGAERALSRRGKRSRPRGVRGDRHRQGPGALRTCRAACRRLPRQLAAGTLAHHALPAGRGRESR